MKNMKKTFILLTASLFLVGCGAAGNMVNKVSSSMSSGNYKVTVWSGGQAVKVYEVKDGFVNTETQSDGYYFNINGKLIRISGTITIEEQ